MFLLSVMWLLENVKILYCYVACLVTIAGEHKTQVLHINPTAAQQLSSFWNYLCYLTPVVKASE